MLPAERKNEILARLTFEGKVIVSDLSRMYGVTEETIRRDLEKLEKEGFAKKIYGGAIKNENVNTELPYMVRKQTNVDKKKYIASIIGSMIKDGDYILLDASTTTLFTVKNISHLQNITLITNSVEVLLEVPQNNNWRVFCTGGSFAPESLSFVGHQAEEIISSYNVNLAVMSCKGIDMERGITDTREGNAQIKKLFIKAADKVILAADSSKFDKVSFVHFADVQDMGTVVTDTRPSDEWMRYFAAGGTQVVYDF